MTNRIPLALSTVALFTTTAFLALPASAQTYYYPTPPVAPAPAVAAPVVILPAEQLDQLTAPIALYPDPLVAQVLTAATYPLDLVTASQWTRSNPNAPDPVIDSQPWPPPVKALIHYPTVLDQLANNLAWTEQLGTAYLNQPADVMSSIQRLRYQAQSAGTLVSTPQQQVIVQNGVIYVIPADPQVIYVPVYDPAVVYYRREPLRFSPGFHIGTWLDLDLDWHDHFVATGVHWDRDHWEHYHNLPERHVGVIRREPRPERHAWTRDPGRPLVIPAPHPEPEHRFYNAPSPAPRAFGDYRPRPDVEHEESRGRESLHQPAPPRIEPARPHPEPAPARREPARAEPSRPAPAGANPYPTQPAAHPQPRDNQDNRDNRGGHDGRADHDDGGRHH